MSEANDYGNFKASLEAIKTAIGDEQHAKLIEELSAKLEALKKKQTDEITIFLDGLTSATFLPEATLEEKTRIDVDGHIAVVGAGLLQCSISDMLCMLAQASQISLPDFISHMIVHYQEMRRRSSGLSVFLDSLLQEGGVGIRVDRIDFGRQKEEEEGGTKKEATQPVH